MGVILIFVLSGFNSYSLVPKESIRSGQGVAIRSSVPFGWIKAISPGVPSVSLFGCRSDHDHFMSTYNNSGVRSLVNFCCSGICSLILLVLYFLPLS